MAEKVSGRWRKIVTVVTLVALGLLIYLTRDEIHETITNFGRVDIAFLSTLVIWKFIAFHGYTKMFQYLFMILSEKIKYWPMYRVNLELNFVNNVFPSGGVTGFSYFSLKMREFDIRAGKSTLVQIFRFAAIFISFQVLLFIGLLILAISGKASNLTILVASSLATFLLVGTLLAAYVVGSKKRIDSFFTGLTKFLNKVIQLVRPKHPETINIASARRMFFDMHENYMIIKKDYKKLKMPLLYALLANIAEVATIYSVYLAFGSPVNVGGVIIAYAVANFAGLISVLPGGIGIYEGLMVAVLASAGIPPSVSIPVTVMYRVLTMLLQLPVGYYFYHKTINATPQLKKS